MSRKGHAHLRRHYVHFKAPGLTVPTERPRGVCIKSALVMDDSACGSFSQRLSFVGTTSYFT